MNFVREGETENSPVFPPSVLTEKGDNQALVDIT
jgi:hypothetical protein